MGAKGTPNLHLQPRTAHTDGARLSVFTGGGGGGVELEPVIVHH